MLLGNLDRQTSLPGSSLAECQRAIEKYEKIQHKDLMWKTPKPEKNHGHCQRQLEKNLLRGKLLQPQLVIFLAPKTQLHPALSKPYSLSHKQVYSQRTLFTGIGYMILRKHPQRFHSNLTKENYSQGNTHYQSITRTHIGEPNAPTIFYMLKRFSPSIFFLLILGCMIFGWSNKEPSRIYRLHHTSLTRLLQPKNNMQKMVEVSRNMQPPSISSFASCSKNGLDSPSPHKKNLNSSSFHLLRTTWDTWPTGFLFPLFSQYSNIYEHY